ncbi:TKL protein kinase, partial [Fonticula alba]
MAREPRAAARDRAPGLPLALLLALLLTVLMAAAAAAFDPAHAAPDGALDAARAAPATRHYIRAVSRLHSQLLVHMLGGLSGGAFASGVAFQSNMSAAVYSQDFLRLDILPEYRLGPFFNGAEVNMGQAPPNPMPDPGQWLLAVTHTSGQAAALLPAYAGVSSPFQMHLYEGLLGRAGLQTTFTGVKDIAAVTLSSRGGDQVLALVFHTDMDMVVVSFSTLLPTNIASGGVLPGMRAIASGRSADTFILWHADKIASVSAQPVVLRPRAQLGKDILDLVESRILPWAPPGGPPDLVVLFADELGIIAGDDLDQSPAAMLRQPLPPGVTATAQARILAPSGQALAQPTGWLFLAIPPAGLFRLALSATPGPGAWDAVSLPLNHEPVTGLKPALMRRGFGAPGAWALVGQYVYFDSVDFGCVPGAGAGAIHDRTIRCNGAPEPPDPQNILGWDCVAGRARSIFSQDGRLCAACADGRTTTMLPLDDSTPCAECQDPLCRACANVDGCLVCDDGHKLQIDAGPPAGERCVLTCDEGFLDRGAYCLPAPRAHLRASAGVLPLPGADAKWHSQVDLVASTRLVRQAGESTPRIGWLEPGASTAGPGEHLLLFHQDGSILWASGAGGMPDATAPLGLSVAMPGAHSYLELVAASRQPSGHPVLVALSTGPAGLDYRRILCQGMPPPSTGAACLAEADPAGGVRLHHSPTSRLVRVNATTAAAVTLAKSVILIRVRPDGTAQLVDTGISVSALPAPFPQPLADPAMVAMGQLLHMAALNADVLLPLEMLVAEDPRVTQQMLLAMPMSSARHPTLQAVALPTGQPGRPEEFLLTGLLDASPPDGARVTWIAQLYPHGLRPHGRTKDIPFNRLPLLDLTAAPAVRDNFQAAPVRLGHAEYPSGLLLLLADGRVALSLLHCPSASPSRQCWLLPGRVFPAPGMPDPSLVGLVALPAAGPAGALSAGPGRGVALALAPGQPALLTIELDVCSAATYSEECLACDPACRQCTGPGPEHCTECTLTVRDRPSDMCVGQCPAGLHANGQDHCDCHGDCLLCLQPDPQVQEYQCVSCTMGMALLPVDADPLLPRDRCYECHASCAECSLPGNPAACISCPAGHYLHQGACVAACPDGFAPQGAHCVPCQAPCLKCPAGVETCALCPARHFIGPAGGPVCRPCDASCDRCTEAGACTTCRSNLVFLATESSTPSLCGSTCAPGEYVGAGRCAACDGSCALCAQAADRCRVCAAGFRWAAGPPAAGATGTCVPCDPGCASCRADGCLVCGAGLVLGTDGQCVTDCPAGMFSNGESCQPCDVSCRTCAGGGADQCTDCGAGLELVEAAPGVGTCVSGCLESEYRAGARRSWAPGPLVALLLVLAAWGLPLARMAPTMLPDMYLQAQPWAFTQSPAPGMSILSHGPDQPGTLCAVQTTGETDCATQTGLRLDLNSDYRVGGAFGRPLPTQTIPLPTGTQEVALRLVSSRQGPALVGVGSGLLLVLDGSQWKTTIIPASSRVLAISASSPSKVAFLVFHSEEGHLKLYQFHGGAFGADIITSINLPASYLGAVVETAGRFVVWNNNIIMVLLPLYPSHQLVNLFNNLPGNVLGVAGTHFYSTNQNGHHMRIIVLDNDQTCTCTSDPSQLTGLCLDHSLDSIPQGVHPAGGRFLDLGPGEVDTPPGWAVFASGSSGLWIVAAPSQGHQLTWRRAIPPAGASDDGATGFRLARLVTGQAGSARTWALVGQQYAYLQPADFLCTDDWSIECVSPQADPSLRIEGYGCVSGRARAALAVPGVLCAGCTDGFTLGDHLLPHSGSCQPCPPNCRTCMPGGQCLVCNTGWLLEDDPSLGARCVSSCGQRFSQAGNRCMPRWWDAQVGLEARNFELPGAAGTPVVLVAQTRLRVTEDQTVVLHPGAWPPGHFLTFSTAGQAHWLLARPGEELFAKALPANFFDSGRVRSYVEVSISANLAVALLADEDGLLSVAELRCLTNGPPPAADGCQVAVDSFYALDLPGAKSLRHLPADGGLVTVELAAGVAYLRVDPDTGAVAQLPAHPTFRHHPVLIPAPAVAGVDMDMLLQPLLAEDAPGTHGAAILPLGLVVTSDPRVDVAAGRDALPAALPSGWRAVALATGRPEATAEVFLSGLAWPKGPAGGAAWRVAHIPRGLVPHLRLEALSYSLEDLAVLPGVTPGSSEDYRVIGVELSASAARGSSFGAIRHPSALLLLTQDQIHVALLECPTVPGPVGGCRLLPGRAFAGLPFGPPGGSSPAVHWVTAVPLAPPVAGSPEADQMLGDLLLATAGPRATILRLSLLTCPEPGQFAPACGGCHAVCATCDGPTEGHCTACRAWLSDSPGVCLEQCPAGMHSVPGGPCLCHASCSECTSLGPPDIGPYQCTKCPPGWMLRLPERDMCLECHESCATCLSPDDPAACSSCHPGQLNHQGTCVSACPTGTWTNGPVAACLPCPDHCNACEPLGNMCSECQAGFFPSSTPGQVPACRPCDASCEQCTGAGACTRCRSGLVFLDPQAPSLCGSTCAPGEYAGAGRCVTCDGSCALCDQGADRCLVCAAGFRWAAGPPAAGATGTCVPCDPGCASCRASGCLVCEAGLVLGPNGQCITDCPAGSFSNGESCQPCDVSCRTCAGGGADQCTGCGAGLELVEAAPGVGTCVSGCLESEYRAGADCLPCDAACATCNGPTDKDCWRCAGAVLQGDDCVQACAAGHVAIAGRCLACHASCSECAGVRSTECTGCPGDLLALPAEQSPSRCAGACPVGYHTSASGCRQCTEHCSSCPHSATTCALCERGWLLASPACVDQCPGSSVALGGLCATCHESCGTCYGPGPEHCLTCGADAPLLVDGRCLATCPAGTFQSGAACPPCSSTCGACSGPGAAECTACPADRVMHGHACLTSCPAGYFAEADRTCGACHGSCLACAGAAADQCTVCPGQTYLDRGLCVGVCPAGTFGCGVTTMCEPCGANCTECVVAAEQPGVGCTPGCLACEGGFVLSPSTGECVADCPAGEYSTGSGTCAPCGPSCWTCLGAAEHCTSCMDPDAWLHAGDGMCLSACPAGGLVAVEFPAAVPPLPRRMCLACPAGCERCAAGPGTPECAFGPDGELSCPVADVCLECEAGLLVLGGACVASCPDGTFADRDAPAPACAPCHANCKTCIGPGEADCSSNKPSGRRLALGLGIGLGLLLLLLLLLLVLFLLLRLRRQRGAPTKTDDDEDATVLNTMLELSLPGSILVSIANDFAPLNEEQLGAGTQASVFAAHAVGAGISDRLGCPSTVAIKQLKAARMTPTQVTLFQNEVALMWLLRDAPNVVRLYGYSEQPPAIVMERFDTDLATLLHSDVPLDQGAILDICQQWASGLEAMHAQGIAHRDLKPGNVFVSQRLDGGWRAALGDLGTSRNLSTDRSSTLVSQAPELNALTARYAAPEVLAAFHRKRPLDRDHYLPADIYSAAIMLWECLHRATPWD